MNVTSLTDALSTVKKLRGVSYNWKKQYTESDKIKNYGLIAQEVEQIIPEATTTDSLGNKMLNYNAIIPYLIEAVKDLSAQVDGLKKQAETSPYSAKSISNATSNVLDVATLYQNSPNPFSQSTEIKYFIPESAGTYILYIYDLQGTQIKNISIQQKGFASITINAAELKAGMYLYSLVVDNVLVDTKRMVLTQ